MFKFAPIIVATFFLSLHLGMVMYVNSSLLGNFFEPNIVSALFIIGALVNISLFLYAPRLIERFGKHALLFFFLLVASVCTLVLAISTTALTVVVSFIIYISFISMIYYYLDIFLEELSLNLRTGEIRGIHLALIHVGIILGLLTLGFTVELTGEVALEPVYLTAALLLIPPILLSLFSFKSHPPKEFKPYHHSPALPFRAWWQFEVLRRITLARLALEFFYALMVIYIPIYLHNYLGFDWSEISIIFIVMLLPFILFQWPAGKLADHFYGEKEILSISFLITIISLLIMPFLGKVFIGWMAILFLSRVGASLVETMTDSYFFKHVDAQETGFLSIFRLTRPIGVVLGAVIGALTLVIFSFEKIFFVLAIVVFLGLKESSYLKDTR